MLFPREMTEIELIVPSKDLLAVTKVLSGYGVFHQTDSNYQGVATGSASTWQETAGQYSALERRIQVIMQSLEIDEGQPPARDFGAMGDVEKLRLEVEQIEEELRTITDALSGQRKRLEQLESTLSQLEPVEGVDVDISSLRNSRYMFSMLGLIPSANIDRLETSLARVPHVFLTLRSDPATPVVWLAGTKGNADVLERAARSAYLNPLTLPDEYQGTPGNIIQSIRNTIESTRRSMEENQAALGRLGEQRRQQLRDLLWQVHTSRVLADAIVRFGQLRHTYVATGWVPTDNLEELTHHLKNASREILVETLPTSRSGPNQNVPVAQTRSKYLEPYQMLVNTYARPRYGELDPTILIAITFPILFGAMFGDIGQGLVLALLGWLIKQGRLMKSLSGLGGLIMACGFSAAFFGVLYGSIFGFEELEILGYHLEPLWISPVHNILDILLISIGAGVILLILGFLIGIFNYARSRNTGHLLFGHNGIAGLALYLSLLGFGAAMLGAIPVPAVVFGVVALVAAIAIMFSEVFIHLVEGHRPLYEGGFFIYLIQAAVELFEVMISLLSNTLSYVRVGAFAVAHGGLSAAIFILAELFAGFLGVIGYWAVIILGNLFIIGFEGLIVGIQTMRLSYYEFFGKFFTGGGMRFEPLVLTPAKEEK